jgi:hypothetical protein
MVPLDLCRWMVFYLTTSLGITYYTYNESRKWTGKTKKSENHPISHGSMIHLIPSPVKQCTPNQESIGQIHMWRGLWVPSRCDAEKTSSPRPAIERTDQDHRRTPTTPRHAISSKKIQLRNVLPLLEEIYLECYHMCRSMVVLTKNNIMQQGLTYYYTRENLEKGGRRPYRRKPEKSEEIIPISHGSMIQLSSRRLKQYTCNQISKKHQPGDS